MPSSAPLSYAAIEMPRIYQTLFAPKPGFQSRQSDDAFTPTAVQNNARMFYQGVTKKNGMSEEQIRSILQEINQKKAVPAFNQALVQLSVQDGKLYRNAEDVIQKELFGNPFKQFFKSAKEKELLDYLNYGENRFSASSLEYRKLGMWNAVADFVAVCKQYPVMSAGVIGAVAYFGHRYPFLGALSGAMIIAWGAGASLIHEVRAMLLPKQTTGKKADHYVKSGENFVAALITALGYKGIKNGNINGFEYAREKAALMSEASLIKKSVNGFWAAVKATSKEKNKTNFVESVLFVSGLFDNVLLPFNWLADKLKINK